jgi:hypothetical protein
MELDPAHPVPFDEFAEPARAGSALAGSTLANGMSASGRSAAASAISSFDSAACPVADSMSTVNTTAAIFRSR